MKFKVKDTFVCIASGPSLTLEDVKFVKSMNCTVIAVNDCWKMAPWADFLYACDARWWDFNNGVPQFSGNKISLEKTKYKDVLSMKQGERLGLSYEWPILCTGYNSGYQAVNLAILLGAKKVILLGYDMKYKNGKKHWFGDHKELQNPIENKLRKWAKYFKSIKDNLKNGEIIINCTRETAIDCFPIISLKEAFNEQMGAVA